MKTYSDLLRDPRWQKKRLEILQRDDFACQKCFDSESTLHVHHRYYKGNANPWEYPETSLVTLCEECHSEETANLKSEKKLLLDELSVKGFMAADFADLAISVHEADPFPFPLDDFVAALGWAIGNEEMRSSMMARHIEFQEERSRQYRNAEELPNG